MLKSLQYWIYVMRIDIDIGTTDQIGGGKGGDKDSGMWVLEVVRARDEREKKKTGGKKGKGKGREKRAGDCALETGCR